MGLVVLRQHLHQPLLGRRPVRGMQQPLVLAVPLPQQIGMQVGRQVLQALPLRGGPAAQFQAVGRVGQQGIQAFRGCGMTQGLQLGQPLRRAPITHRRCGIEHGTTGLYWTGLLTVLLVGGASLFSGARYLSARLRLSPALLLRSGG